MPAPFTQSRKSPKHTQPFIHLYCVVRRIVWRFCENRCLFFFQCTDGLCLSLFVLCVAGYRTSWIFFAVVEIVARTQSTVHYCRTEALSIPCNNDTVAVVVSGRENRNTWTIIASDWTRSIWMFCWLAGEH